MVISNEYEARIEKLIKELDQLRSFQALDHKLIRRWLKLPLLISAKEQDHIGMAEENIRSYYDQIKNGQDLDDVSSMIETGDNKRGCNCKCHTTKGRDRVQTVKFNRDNLLIKIQPADTNSTEVHETIDQNLSIQHPRTLELKDKEIEDLKAQLIAATS